MKCQPDSKPTPEVDAFAENSSESVNADRMSIGRRMKAAMEAAGLTQARLAELIGIASVRGIQENVSGKTAPGGNVLSGLVRGGVNVNWVVAGVGPMLLRDLTGPVRLVAADNTGAYQVQAPPPLDLQRLQLAISTVEEALEQTRRTMDPARKAELVLAVYDLYQEPANTHDRVLKLVKLAS